MNIGKLHFIKAGEVIETGLITDQIFPWPKTKDLIHEVLGNCTKLVDPSCKSKFELLASKWSAEDDS